MKAMTNSEIWEGWCGNASPLSEEGAFSDYEDALAYVLDRKRDWANETLSIEIDESSNEVIRYIADMTDDEVDTVAQAIMAYREQAIAWAAREEK